MRSTDGHSFSFMSWITSWPVKAKCLSEAKMCCVVFCSGMFHIDISSWHLHNDLRSIDEVVSVALSDCSSAACLLSHGWRRAIIDCLLGITGASVCKWIHPRPANSTVFHKVEKQQCHPNNIQTHTHAHKQLFKLWLKTTQIQNRSSCLITHYICFWQMLHDFIY